MSVQAWLASTLARTLDPMAGDGELHLPAVRGESISLQVIVNVGVRLAAATVTVAAEEAGDLPLRIRRVDSVPVDHHTVATEPDQFDRRRPIPGLVPDVLVPAEQGRFGCGEQALFWITVSVPVDARVGAHRVVVRVRVDDEALPPLHATVTVADVVLQRRRDFHMTHWFYADALCDWYGVAPWSEAFWPICRRYFDNYARHGNDTVYVPAFTPPLDGVKRPTQLLHVTRRGDGTLSFDWTQVARWVREARAAGLTCFEWTHLFTQWGAASAIRVYEGHGEDERLLWPAETPATAPVYRAFLARYLAELHGFLEQHELLKRSFFHVSDEPHGDRHLQSYREARSLLTELAPWMKVMDALSDIRYAREGLTDMPIPSVAVARQFVEEDIPCWCYYCCGERGRLVNRFLDTPPAKIRMNGWLFYRFGVRGFLHWGYNYWYRRQSRELIDPFRVTDAHAWPNWVAGDPFVVYPGPAEVGPYDSVRWEVFHESLQDYALLQTLDVPRDGALLADLRDFNDFPWSPDFVPAARATLLRI